MANHVMPRKNKIKKLSSQLENLSISILSSFFDTLHRGRAYFNILSFQLAEF